MREAFKDQIEKAIEAAESVMVALQEQEQEQPELGTYWRAKALRQRSVMKALREAQTRLIDPNPRYPF